MSINVKPSENRLIGQKEICAYCSRPWDVVRVWIKKDGFPAKEINGRWESLKTVVDQWFETKIS